MGKLLTISNSEEPFMDRAEAGRLLARELSFLSDKAPLVLGIPRGGVMVAREIASRYDADLDVILSRSLEVPGVPEGVAGAVSEDGRLIVTGSHPEQSAEAGELSGHREGKRDRQYTHIAGSIERYRSVRPRASLKGRVVVITDDGMDTGNIMQASLLTAREEGPDRLIAAVPVASIEAVDRIADYADEVIALRVPPVFYSIDQFYEFYEETSDEEVVLALKQSIEEKEW